MLILIIIKKATCNFSNFLVPIAEVLSYVDTSLEVEVSYIILKSEVQRTTINIKIPLPLCNTNIYYIHSYIFVLILYVETTEYI